MPIQIKNALNQNLTLTKEQEACLNYSGDKMLMVKGVAGAGKSLILQALAKKMLDSYSGEKKERVAIFTFSNTLSSATKEFLKANGDSDDFITVTTVDKYLIKVYQKMGGPYLKTLKDPLYSSLKNEAMTEVLSEHKTQHGQHRFHNLDISFLIEECEWMKDMNISVDDKDVYMTIPRKGRGTKVRMSSTDREVAFQIYEMYDQKRKAKKLGDWFDYALYINHHADDIKDEMRFDHILIDEAQDLSLAKMLALTKLFRKDMVIAMDMNQRIFDKQWTNKQLGIESTTKKLTKSMRTTKQIDDLAESIRSRNDQSLDDEDRTIRAIPEKEGPLPELVHLEDRNAERKYVIEQVTKWLGQTDKASIAIIAAKNYFVNVFSGWMTDANIPHEIIRKDSDFSVGKPGVKIVGAHSTKGLEFTRVIIPQFEEGNFPYSINIKDDDEAQQLFIERSRNLVYVAMTRAQYSLTITYSGLGSRFIGEMDPTLFEAKGLPITYEKRYVHEFVKPLAPEKKNTEDYRKTGMTLVRFFTERNLKVIDQRDTGGYLWVIGTKKTIGKDIAEAQKRFGLLVGRYANASSVGETVGWWTKSKK